MAEQDHRYTQHNVQASMNPNAVEKNSKTDGLHKHVRWMNDDSLLESRFPSLLSRAIGELPNSG
jgi:hypothetical protein